MPPKECAYPLYLTSCAERLPRSAAEGQGKDAARTAPPAKTAVLTDSITGAGQHALNHAEFDAMRGVVEDSDMRVSAPRVKKRHGFGAEVGGMTKATVALPFRTDSRAAVRVEGLTSRSFSTADASDDGAGDRAAVQIGDEDRDAGWYRCCPRRRRRCSRRSDAMAMGATMLMITARRSVKKSRRFYRAQGEECGRRSVAEAPSGEGEEDGFEAGALGGDVLERSSRARRARRKRPGNRRRDRGFRWQSEGRGASADSTPG